MAVTEEEFFKDLQAQTGASFTSAARALIIRTAKQSRRKKRQAGTVSCTGVFLAAIDINFEEEGAFDDEPDAAAVRIVGSYVVSRASERLATLVDGYFGEAARPDEEVALTATTSLTGVLKPLAKNGNGSPIRADTLLAAVIAAEQSRLAVRLRSLKLTPQQLLDILDGRTNLGGNLRQERDPSDEKPLLETPSYAAAIAAALRAAHGEYCFGLFGHWGVGKTRLVDTMAPLLTSPELFRMRNRSSLSPVARGLRYNVVKFSAWAYPKPPEAWVFLYDTLARTALQGGLWRPIERLIRVVVWRSGYWPVVFAIAAFFLASMSATTLVIALGLVATLGFAWGAYLTGVVAGGSTFLKGVASRFQPLARNAERLGMQALVGEDLKALLVAWMPSSGTKTSKLYRDELARRRNPLWFGMAVAALAAGWATLIFFQGNSNPAEMLCSIEEPDKKAACLRMFSWTALGVGDPPGWILGLRWMAFSLAALLSVLVLKSVAAPARGPDRVLLFVDDLDRCMPADALQIMEALKLTVQEPAISSRMQVLMATDEDVLRFAIASKFEGLVKARSRAGDGPPRFGQVAPPGGSDNIDPDAPTAPGNIAIRDEIVREHIEKLFACHLRMPPITAEEVSVLVDSFAGAELDEKIREQIAKVEDKIRANSGPRKPDVVERHSAPDPSQPPSHFRRDIPEIVSRTRTTVTVRQGESDAAFARRWEEVERLTREAADLERRLRLRDGPATADVQVSDLLYTDHEVDVLREELPRLIGHGGKRASPRTVRLFLFKYQLCRSLIAQMGRSALYPPRDIVSRLAEACFSSAPGEGGGENGRTSLDYVVRQVV